MTVITTETRLDMRGNPDIIEYAKSYLVDYGIMQRYVWRRIVQTKGRFDKSKLNIEVQRKFGVTKRTANVI